MIGKLSGRIDSVRNAQLVLDVQGVGYVVTCSAHTLRQIAKVGEEASLLVETQVREDAISLFGFATHEEQDWFRLLITVQGVGAKVALAILGSLSLDQLAQSIAAQDKAALTTADGVGPKLALRLVTELKDKIPTFFTVPPNSDITSQTRIANLTPSLAGDAISALVNLGYRRSEAFRAVAAVSHQNPTTKLDELIRLSLYELSHSEKVA